MASENRITGLVFSTLSTILLAGASLTAHLATTNSAPNSLVWKVEGKGLPRKSVTEDF